MNASPTPLLTASNLTKNYKSVVALNDVSFSICKFNSGDSRCQVAIVHAGSMRGRGD